VAGDVSHAVVEKECRHQVAIDLSERPQFVEPPGDGAARELVRLTAPLRTPIHARPGTPSRCPVLPHGSRGSRQQPIRCVADATLTQARDFDNQVWAAHRREIITQGNLEKFRQNRALLEFLLATAGTVLVEASPHDQIWGIGLRQDDPRAVDPAQWRGSNLLGFALVEVRAELRE